MRTKYSKQRALMLEELQNRCDHPTADDLYVSLREKMPNISLATVYRNLGLLEQHGMVRRILASGPDHFDADVSLHHHLLCKGCGAVIDVFLAHDDMLCQRAQNVTDGQIDDYALIFYGVCEICMQKDSLSS